METPWTFYLKLSGLFLLLTAVITYHYGRHGLRKHPRLTDRHVAAADPQVGGELIQRYGCGGCHVIPGVPGAKGNVGPRLDHLSDKIYIAGVLPHSPQNLVLWIRDPRRVDPHTAMPDLGVGPREARDIAAYLYTLDQRRGLW